MRDTTERQKRLMLHRFLVGTDDKIVRECNSLLNDTVKYEHMCLHNPYGDGKEPTYSRTYYAIGTRKRFNSYKIK
jgi:UDP-N-acetylglucosamine 2-epimerase